MNHVFIWVIQTKKPEIKWFGRKCFQWSADRTAFNNKRHLTPIHYRIRLFKTKADATTYFYKKVRAGVAMQNCKVTRRKLFLKKNGQYDYWKNSAHFRSKW
jgi:hypothetical protein